MRIIKATCQNCHANLEIDLDNFQANCPYCGGSYLIESEQMSQALKEKEITKRLEIVQKTNRIKAKEENKPILYCFLFMALVLLGLGISGLFMHFSDPEVKALHNLEKLERNIIAYVDSQNYDKALVEANKINPNEHISKKDKQVWQEKKDNYIKLITQEKREYDLSNPDNLLAPLSSKDFKNKTGEEAYSIFSRAGFKNVKRIYVNGSAGWFKKKNLVEHINFGGKTEFTTDDYINKNDRIDIYYYLD